MAVCSSQWSMSATTSRNRRFHSLMPPRSSVESGRERKYHTLFYTGAKSVGRTRSSLHRSSTGTPSGARRTFFHGRNICWASTVTAQLYQGLSSKAAWKQTSSTWEERLQRLHAVIVCLYWSTWSLGSWVPSKSLNLGGLTPAGLLYLLDAWLLSFLFHCLLLVFHAYNCFLLHVYIPC